MVHPLTVWNFLKAIVWRNIPSAFVPTTIFSTTAKNFAVLICCFRTSSTYIERSSEFGEALTTCIRLSYVGNLSELYMFYYTSNFQIYYLSNTIFPEISFLCNDPEIFFYYMMTICQQCHSYIPLAHCNLHQHHVASLYTQCIKKLLLTILNYGEFLLT